MVEGVDVYGVCSLSEVMQFLRGEKGLGTGAFDQRLDERSTV